MKLLDDVIALLSDPSGSLTDALLKTKVLMHAIGHKELAEWVNAELNGYSQDKPVPKYRVIGTRVMGVIQNCHMIYKGQALPTAHLPDEVQTLLQKYELRESISVLEQFASKTDEHLSLPVMPELYGELGKPYEGAWIVKAWRQMEPTRRKDQWTF